MFDAKLTEIANQLVANCREGKEIEGLDRLYDPNAVSVEAAEMQEGGGAETRGRDAIKGKHEWWRGAFEVHSAKIEGPFFHGVDRFGVIFEIDTSNRETKERLLMKEIGIYTVKDGKIIREEFFYNM